MSKRPDAKCPPRHLWMRVEYCATVVAVAPNEHVRKVWLIEGRRAIDEWWDACEVCLKEWERTA